MFGRARAGFAARASLRDFCARALRRAPALVIFAFTNMVAVIVAVFSCTFTYVVSVCWCS